MNIRRRAVQGLRLLLPCAVVAALLAGGATSSGEALRSQRPKAQPVEIREFAFHPALLRIEPGERVVFVNRDPVRHDATGGDAFATGELRRGDAWAVRFPNRGTYRYLCTLHEYMRGKVVVRPDR